MPTASEIYVNSDEEQLLVCSDIGSEREMRQRRNEIAKK
jgi:hypothetical protein